MSADAAASSSAPSSPKQRQIYINLRVADLAAAISFYEAISFVQDPQCSGPTAVGRKSRSHCDEPSPTSPLPPILRLRIHETRARSHEADPRGAVYHADNPSIYLMLISPGQFTDFLPRDRTHAEPRTHTEVLLCLGANSLAEADGYADRAVAAGGKADPCPKQEIPGVYGRSWEDLDGHLWEVVWVDVEAMGCGKADDGQAQSQTQSQTQV